jgi:hypothetical protein
MENQVVDLAQKISPESAQEQVDLFASYYELEPDDIENEDAKKAVSMMLGKLKRYVMKTRVEIQMDGDSLKVIQKLRKPINGLDTVVYKELTGLARVRMKDREDNDNYGKVYSLMGGLCGEPDSTMLKFSGVDLSTMETIGGLFLAV